MLTSAPSPKPCENCRKPFVPQFSTTQVCCSMRCASAYVRRLRLSKEKQERAQTKERKRALDTIPELIRAADRAFAAFIRERDRQAGFLCISSGKPLDWSGNKVDAGHWRSRGAASHLRYNEDNCHAQTKQENRYKAGNAVDYRVNLLVRIGLERVEALEADNEPHKWTREELRAIRATYAAKARELKAQKETA